MKDKKVFKIMVIGTNNIFSNLYELRLNDEKRERNAEKRKKAILMNVLLGDLIFTDLEYNFQIWGNDKSGDYKVAGYDSSNNINSTRGIHSIVSIEPLIKRMKEEIKMKDKNPLSRIVVEGKIPEMYGCNYKLCYSFECPDSLWNLSKIVKIGSEYGIFIYLASKEDLYSKQDKKTYLQRIAELIKDDEECYKKYIWLLDVGLDPETSSHIENGAMIEVQNLIMKMYEQLTNIGLKNPVIIPVDLMDGQILQKVKKGYKLTEFESVEYHWLYQGANRRNLEQYALINSELKNKLEKKLEIYQNVKDKTSEILLHTGIPVLKAVIEGKIQEFEKEERKEVESKEMKKKTKIEERMQGLLVHNYNDNKLTLQDIFASAQILMFNPVLKETETIRMQYFTYLKKLVCTARWNRRKYVAAQISFYEKKLCGGQVKFSEDLQYLMFNKKYCYLMPFDLAVMSGFDFDLFKDVEGLIHTLVFKFKLPFKDVEFMKKEFKVMCGKTESWDEIIHNKNVEGFQDYLEKIKCNALFLKKEPYQILITATMSAGKSTLINALVGKNISRMQNMACTSKIHTIVAKAVEDGMTSEYDHDIVLEASKEELLNDNEDNRTNTIIVGTYFNGVLGGQRIEMHDSPGVNSSEHEEHTKISKRMISSGNYELLLYVLNATQLGTNDNESHLTNVLKKSGCENVLFILNKADTLIADEEDVWSIIERQKEYLISRGFQHPIICPVSARAAYLAKKSVAEGLTRMEQREADLYMDKFERKSFAPYYNKIFDEYRMNIELKKEQREIKQRLEETNHDTLKNCFTVNVISTMSAGKSTLINALLRRELLPSKQEACTAVITEIYDTDNLDSFTADVYDEEDNLLQKNKLLDYEIMDKLNRNIEVGYIRAWGDIPFVDCSDVQLRIVDTPGPNNSRTEVCRKKTYIAINRDSNNLILYVLNGTQLGTNDDASLLYYIAEQIKKGGKQVRDRFLFVVNKMDQFNPEKEDIPKVIQSAKEYLAKHGIDDPQIFPCSAFAALNIRTELAEIDVENLTRTQERQLSIAAREALSMLDKLNEYEAMHFEKYSTLSPSTQERLNYRLQQAVEEGDTKEQALIHSGIYSIELALREHMEKYIEVELDKIQADRLLENSGFTYLEEIIKYLSSGGR